MPVPIGVLASGEGTNLQALLDATEAGRLGKGAIRLVISNKPDAPALGRAKKHNVSAVYIDPTEYKGRRWEYDQLVVRALEQQGITPDAGLVVLAGYMRILSPEFVRMYHMRIMNIHPALLPSFPGLEAAKQAFEYGVRVTGVTVHFVDEGVDTGPIVLQEPVQVRRDETLETLMSRIHDVEHKLYPEAVRLFTEGKLAVEGRRVKVLL